MEAKTAAEAQRRREVFSVCSLCLLCFNVVIFASTNGANEVLVL